jgi:hypothetical protein
MIEECPPLDSLLESLNRDQLQLLLLKLAEQEPSLVGAIKSRITSLFPASSEATTEASAPVICQRVQVDPKAVRSQVQSIIHSLDRMQSSEAYRRVGEVFSMIREILDQAWTLIEAKDGGNALTLLEGITEGYMADWEILDGSSGETGEFFYDLAAAWEDALLCANLSQKERESWTDRLTVWREELDDYGVGDAFDIASLAQDQVGSDALGPA